MRIIADGTLLDLLRKVRCFGVHLVQAWICARTASATGRSLSELTRYLGLGDYAGWDESARRAFLLRELASRRPLVSAPTGTERRDPRDHGHLCG